MNDAKFCTNFTTIQSLRYIQLLSKPPTLARRAECKEYIKILLHTVSFTDPHRTGPATVVYAHCPL